MKRFVVISAFVTLLVGIVTMPSGAASFVDWTPCPAQHQFLVCPTGQVGQSYDIQLLARDGCDLYRWEIVNGSLPPGLSMSSSGKVTGVPTGVSETVPWVHVHDLLPHEGGHSWCIGDNRSERQFVFRTVAGLGIVENGIPGGTTGQPYSKQLSAQSLTSLNPRTGSPATATWRVQSGNLPAGIALSSSGLLSGTPTTAASSTFVVRAEGGGGAFATATYTLPIRPPVAVNAALPKSEVGMPFTMTPAATGGSGTYTWSIKGALPAGLALAANGAISGTPSIAGRFPFTLTATDSEGRIKSLDVILVVKPKLAITTRKLAPVEVDEALRVKIGRLGGVGPFVWTMTGKAPKGVKFAPKLGLLLGTPTQAGTFNLTFQVIDALGARATKKLKFVVTD